MKVAIVGFGSAGKRHYANLEKLGCTLAVVSRRKVEAPNLFSSVGECEKFFTPDLFFVCTETSRHESTLFDLKAAGFSKKVIIEKPVFSEAPKVNFEDDFADIRISYNFRFNSLLIKLKDEIKNERVLNATAYVGQYLPQWRPQTDYRQSYSAKALEGGGVLLDLSHEFDYLHWLLGPAQGVFAMGGKLSSLEIDSEDTANILMQFQDALANVHLNYLDRQKNRFLILNTDVATYKLNFVTNEFTKNDVTAVIEDNSQLSMAKDIVVNEAQGLTSYKDALSVLNTVLKCRKSMTNKTWETL